MQEVKDVFNKVREGFTYKSDMDRLGVVENWDDALDKLDGEWAGDCDDFCCSAALLALKYGISDDKVRIVFCKVETGGGHLICCIDIDGPDGEDTLCIDNRQKFVVSASELGDYTFVSGMRLSEPGVWRKIN